MAETSLADQCRAWLRFSYAPDRILPNLKIATYDGVGGGSGEPDRGMDPAVREADMRRALGLVPDAFVRRLGWVSRNLPPRKFDKVFGVRRSDRELILWAATEAYTDWSKARVTRLAVNPGEPPWVTLAALLDECAQAMARAMGDKDAELPRRRPVLASTGC